MLKFYNKKDDKKLHVVFVISLIVFSICSVYLLRYVWGSITSTKNNEKALNHFKDVADADEELSDKYAKMRDKYPEVIGRLIFNNNSKVMSFLVMQSDVTDHEKYLELDPFGEPCERGTPFLDAWCGIKDKNKLSDNFLIYSHNYKDGTMFGSLDNNYKDKLYWEKYPTIKFETMYDDMAEYEIFAAFYSKRYNVGDRVFKYYKFKDAANEEEFNDFVNNVKRLSLYDTKITPKYGEQLLTLSTCSYHIRGGRFAVVARRKDGRSPK